MLNPRAASRLVEFRSSNMWHAMVDDDPDIDPIADGRRALLRVSDDADSHVAGRVRATAGILYGHALLWGSFFTSWFAPTLLVEERIVGWLEGGVVHLGDHDNQLFWIRSGRGIVGDFSGDVGCHEQGQVQPMCRPMGWWIRLQRLHVDVSREYLARQLSKWTGDQQVVVRLRECRPIVKR